MNISFTVGISLKHLCIYFFDKYIHIHCESKGPAPLRLQPEVHRHVTHQKNTNLVSARESSDAQSIVTASLFLTIVKKFKVPEHESACRRDMSLRQNRVLCILMNL